MIKSLRDKDTQGLFEGRCPRRWQAIRRVAERKLIQLNAAATLDFLRAPPGNRLEALRETVRASSASTSTASGVCALLGQPEMYVMLRL